MVRTRGLAFPGPIPVGTRGQTGRLPLHFCALGFENENGKNYSSKVNSVCSRTGTALRGRPACGAPFATRLPSCDMELGDRRDVYRFIFARWGLRTRMERIILQRSTPPVRAQGRRCAGVRRVAHLSRRVFPLVTWSRRTDDTTALICGTATYSVWPWAPHPSDVQGCGSSTSNTRNKLVRI